MSARSAISVAHDDVDLDSVITRLLAEHCPPAALRAADAEHGAVDRALWKELVDGGWTGIAASESAGGSGQGVDVLQLVLYRLGEAGAPVPFPAAVAEVSTFLDRCLYESADAGELVSAICAGQIWVPAVPSATPGTDIDGPVSNGRVTATREFVPYASDADGFLVAQPRSDSSVAWYAVPRSPRISMQYQPNPSTAARYLVHFDRAESRHLGTGPVSLLGELRVLRWLAEASWTVGLLRRVLAMTVDHVSVRHQFGRAIGSFQAVQHKLSDVTIMTQLCSHLSRSAAFLCDEEGVSSPAAEAEAAAAVDASRRTAALAAKHCHQLWGGAGVSVEYDLHLFTSRLQTMSHCTDDHEVARELVLARQMSADRIEP